MPNNAPHNALRAAVNRAIDNGSPIITEQRPGDMPDIPEFLRRRPGDVSTASASAATTIRETKTKRPANWHALTKAEQEGTADPVTVALRKELERDRQAKQNERFAHLRELAAERAGKRAEPSKSQTSSATHTLKKTVSTVPSMSGLYRFGVVTDKGIAFSFDAKDSHDARTKFSAMRKRGDVKGHKVTSLRRLRPNDHAIDGGAIPYKESI